MRVLNNGKETTKYKCDVSGLSGKREPPKRLDQLGAAIGNSDPGPIRATTFEGKGEQHDFTQEQVKSLSSARRTLSTSRRTISVISPTTVSFRSYPFQQKLVSSFNDNRFTICKLPRQSGKSVVTTAYLIHQAIRDNNINIAILANKRDTAFELMRSCRLLARTCRSGCSRVSYPGTKVLSNQNGSRITASSTSSSAVRGFSDNVAFLDDRRSFQPSWLTSSSRRFILLFHLVRAPRLLSFPRRTV